MIISGRVVYLKVHSRYLTFSLFCIKRSLNFPDPSSLGWVMRYWAVCVCVCISCTVILWQELETNFPDSLCCFCRPHLSYFCLLGTIYIAKSWGLFPRSVILKLLVPRWSALVVHWAFLTDFEPYWAHWNQILWCGGKFGSPCCRLEPQGHSQLLGMQSWPSASLHTRCCQTCDGASVTRTMWSLPLESL